MFMYKFNEITDVIISKVFNITVDELYCLPDSTFYLYLNLFESMCSIEYNN